MKTRYWILLLCVLLAVCIGLSIPLLLPGEAARYAEIISDGQLMHTVDLKIDRQIHISTSKGGQNTVTIKDGKIGVTEANCPDHYCMDRGYCNGGAQIVCLPNRLVIKFVAPQEIDGVVG